MYVIEILNFSFRFCVRGLRFFIVDEYKIKFWFCCVSDFVMVCLRLVEVFMIKDVIVLVFLIV